MKTFIDSATNAVTISQHGEWCVALLTGGSGCGYVAHGSAEDFGTDTCPSGPPVATWFGPGERYPDAESALRAVNV